MNAVEELLNFCEMKGTTGEDIMSCVEKIVDQYKLPWNNLISVATDGAPSMVGRNFGFICRLQNKLKCLTIPHGIIPIHCMIHKQNLFAKSVKFEAVMSVVVRVINFLRNHELQLAQLRPFLKELNSENGELPYFTEIQWLSRGKAVERFFMFRKEIRLSMEQTGNPVPELENSNWMKDLAFLADLITHLNALNIKMQGKDKTIIDLFDVVTAFKIKLNLWVNDLEFGNTQDFPKLNSVSNDGTYEHYLSVLRNLNDEFSNHFKELLSLEIDFDILSAPFAADYRTALAHLRMELIDLTCNRALKLKSSDLSVLKFYQILPRNEYPVKNNICIRFYVSFQANLFCNEAHQIENKKFA
ncbi:general transcription factor II-I repeat domain-containing protein 2-like [Nomia melanderi]|uniref:general transcription factor II-I repeat domain-containing protein 2-like n=1 Tax=Nomia melanderi TaxID=2448451 RepID=UPI003FCCCFA3